MLEDLRIWEQNIFPSEFPEGHVTDSMYERRVHLTLKRFDDATILDGSSISELASIFMRVTGRDTPMKMETKAAILAALRDRDAAIEKDKEDFQAATQKVNALRKTYEIQFMEHNGSYNTRLLEALYLSDAILQLEVEGSTIVYVKVRKENKDKDIRTLSF